MISPGNAFAAEQTSAVQIKRGPLLLVLSGPSGVGKTTVTKALVEQGWPGHVVVTATTRRPRPSEIDGVHYHFRTLQQFQQMIERNELLEYAEVHGNLYGVPADDVRQHLHAGMDVILTIDPQGAQTVRRRVQGAIFVFLAPESIEELVERVNQRGQDSPEQRALRLLNAERELAQAPSYDYLIVNQEGHLTETVEQLKAIMLAEHLRVEPHVPAL
ncbi:MAG TPA: guanylate kinase [Ktedonobacterales bacterium]